MSRPSVLLVTDTLVVGGLERLVVEFARELDARGWRVGLLAGPGPLWAEVPAGVTRHSLPATDPVRAAAVVRRTVRNGAYDVVHAHQRGVALAARVGLGRRGVPVVEHVHNVFRPTLPARLLAFRGELIACGSAVATMLVDDFGRPVERVHLVRNGVRDPGVTIGRDVPRAGLHIVGVGRLTEQKDPVRFVRVVAALVAELGADAVSAEWVGDGPLMPDVRVAVEAAGLASVVRLTGELPSAAERIASADLLLSTSRWEGLPLVALEALALGRGALLPDVGSCRDAVSGGAGAVYRADLPDADLARLIADLHASGRLADWRAAARGAWEAEFAFERVVDGVERVLRSAAGIAPAQRVLA